MSARSAAAHVSRSYAYPYALVGCHCEPVGVDIEPAQPLTSGFLASIQTPSERGMAVPGEGHDRDTRAVSLWSGKEALAKALGDALRYDPPRLGSPVTCPDGRCGRWRAEPLDGMDGHVGWVCWAGRRVGRPRGMTGVRRQHLVAPAALGLALAACGGGHLAAVDRPQASVHRHAARRYRWTVRTSGSPPTIAQGNRARGTRGWRLAGPAAQVGGVATGTVRGYVAEQAVLPGQLQSIDVSAPGARTVTIRIYRLGWYGGTGGHEVLVAQNLPEPSQPACRHSAATGLTECSWHPTLRFRIPPALPSGVYIARLSALTGASDCLFVARSRQPQPLLAQLPTAAYEAYNRWGVTASIPAAVA